MYSSSLMRYQALEITTIIIMIKMNQEQNEVITEPNPPLHNAPVLIKGNKVVATLFLDKLPDLGPSYITNVSWTILNTSIHGWPSEWRWEIHICVTSSLTVTRNPGDIQTPVHTMSVCVCYVCICVMCVLCVLCVGVYVCLCVCVLFVVCVWLLT